MPLREREKSQSSAVDSEAAPYPTPGLKQKHHLTTGFLKKPKFSLHAPYATKVSIYKLIYT